VDFALAFTLFIGALSFGASGCLIGCMPVLSPLIASNAVKNESIRVWLFTLATGRIAGYVFIAVLSFAGLGYVKSLIGSTELVSKLFGTFIILVSFMLLIQVFYPFLHRCGAKNISKVSPFGIGLGLALSFCPAVLQLASVSATVQNIGFAVVCGAIFGIGVSVVPSLFYGFALFPLIKNGVAELVRYKKMLEIFSALLFLFSGMAIFFGVLKI